MRLLRRLGPLSWAALGILILIVLSFLVITRCGPSAPEVKPTVAPTPTALPEASIGRIVRDVAGALRKYDDFIFDPKHPACERSQVPGCVSMAERDKVMEAFRAYMAARPAKKLSSADPTQAPDAMIVASRDLVVAIADCIERKR